MAVLTVSSALLILVVVGSGSALRCYSCTTPNHPDPGVPVPKERKECPHPSLLLSESFVTKCDETATRCAKYEFSKDDVKVVFRGCAEATFCSRLRLSQPNDNYSCNTCSKDKCNGAATHKYSSTLFAPVALLWLTKGVL